MSAIIEIAGIEADHRNTLRCEEQTSPCLQNERLLSFVVSTPIYSGCTVAEQLKI